MLKKYEFDLTLQGIGHNVEEAWANAVEGFELDPGCVPETQEPVEYIDEDNPCESCRKCGENICGNDTERHRCYEPLED